MENLLEDLTTVLAQDERLVVDGALNKNKVIELGLQIDADLMNLLLKSESIKNAFFTEVGQALVFDKIKFQKFVSNKKFLPDSYTEFKNKVGLAADGDFLVHSSQIELVWPYKDCVFEGGQADDAEKRYEIFWNQTLAPNEIDRLLEPKALTNFQRFDKDGAQVDIGILSTGDSLLVKGNNLLTLHTLKNKYAGKVKVIYIDPPYNPTNSKNNTFTYNNTFNRSTWLTFMKNRIEVARDFLTNDGCLIVAIDENEQAHLGVLLKESFPRHEVHCITIVHNPRGVQGANFSYTHEYAFFVIPKGKKSIQSMEIADENRTWDPLRNWGGESERSDAANCFYPVKVKDGTIVGFGDVPSDDEHPARNVQVGDEVWIYPIDNEGVERKWRYARQSVEAIQHLLKAQNTKGVWDIKLSKDTRDYPTVWTGNRYDANTYGTKVLKALVPDADFLFPKSLWNVYDCLNAIVGADKDAIIMDFFAGSGTTGQAVMELNKKDGGSRRFILAEQMHYVQSVTKERLRRATEIDSVQGFVYCELAEANENFVQKIMMAETTEALWQIWLEMQETAFMSYRDVAGIKQVSEVGFGALEINQIRTFLLEMLDKNMLYVPFSEIEDSRYSIAQSVREINQAFFHPGS
jgi:adenine-specific DNA-methyltransferase